MATVAHMIETGSDTNLELSSTFAGKFEGGADKKKLPNLKSSLNVNNARF